MPVDSRNKQYTTFLQQWERCRDCYDGSDAVKRAGAKYLPKLDSHVLQGGEQKYEAYKMRALFYNAMGRTVDGLAGSIFQKAPVIEFAPVAKAHIEDVTLNDMPAELFGLRVTQETLITGRCGVLVDMSLDPSEARPYWAWYRAEDIVSWWVLNVGGDRKLVRVVLRETVEAPSDKDQYVFDETEQFRVLSLGENGYTVSVWQRPKNAKESAQFDLISSMQPLRRGEPLTFIPFVFIGSTGIQPAVCKPPLLDLADVSLSHYRTSADLEHGRHFTALPTPYVTGAVSNEGPLHIGSGTAWVLEKGGSAGMLEFSGAGLQSLVTADSDKRKMMATLGARLLEEQAATAETATAVSMRHAGDHATLRTIAGSVEQGLTLAARWHSWWAGAAQEVKDVKAKYELNKDFFNARMQPGDLQSLVMALQAETISYETFYFNIMRGELTRPGVDAAAERAAIESTAGEFAPDADPARQVPPAGKPEDEPEDEPEADE